MFYTVAVLRRDVFLLSSRARSSFAYIRRTGEGIKSHGNARRAGEDIGTLFHFRCITPGCGVPDCTTVAQRVPLTPARSTCQLDCNRNVGCAGTTAFPRPRHRCATMYIPLRQPLSRYLFCLYRYPCCASFPASGEIRRAIPRWLMGFEIARIHSLNFAISVWRIHSKSLHVKADWCRVTWRARWVSEVRRKQEE